MTTNNPISVLRAALSEAYDALVDASMTTANDYSRQMGIAAAALAATEQAAIQPAGEAEWQKLTEDSDINYARFVDVVLTNGVYEYCRRHDQVDWTHVSDWRYASLAAPAAQQAKAEQCDVFNSDSDNEPAFMSRTATPASKPEASELPPLFPKCAIGWKGQSMTELAYGHTDGAMTRYGQLCRDTASGTRLDQADAAPSDRDAALEEAAALFDCPVDADLRNHDVAGLIRELKGKSAAPVAPEQAVTDAERVELDMYHTLYGTKFPEGATIDVLAERQRQKDVEGWTLAHDDAYQNGELARAAAAYTLNSVSKDDLYIWPWPKAWWKPTDARRNLVKAGALILAEIERLDRAAILAKRSGRTA